MIKALAQSTAKRLFGFLQRKLFPPMSLPGWVSQVDIPGLVATPQGLSGQVGSWQVEITRKEEIRSERIFFRISVLPVRTGLVIAPATASRKAGGIRLHEKEFDSRVHIAGDAGDALILLEEEVRTLAERLVIELNGSMLGLKLAAEVEAESELSTAVQDLLGLAGHLERQHSKGLAEKLRQVVSTPHTFPDLRREALDGLRAQFEATRWQAPAPVGVPDSPLVRMHLDAAALLLYLDEEARTLAMQLILKTLLSTWLPAEPRHAALRLLIEESDREAAKPVLEAWLSKPIEDPDLRRAAIRACARRLVIGPLLELEIESEAEGLALLEAFAEIGDPAAQGRAIQELGHPSQRVRTAAATTLGRLGNLDAIPPLVDALSQNPDRRLRRAIQEATTSIQERAGVFQSGELSITQVGPLEGSLSHADGTTGAEVSLVDPPETE